VHLFHFNRHPVDLENVSANRHLSFVFWSKSYFGRLQLKTRDLSEKGGVLESLKPELHTHMGGLKFKGGLQISGLAEDISTSNHSLFIFPQMSLCCDPFFFVNL